MKQSRLRFKSALRYCKTNEDAMRFNAFAKSLMDEDKNSFLAWHYQSQQCKNTFSI